MTNGFLSFRDISSHISLEVRDLCCHGNFGKHVIVDPGTPDIGRIMNKTYKNDNESKKKKGNKQTTEPKGGLER